MIPAIIAQMFIAATELVIPTGISINEANAEIETQPVIAETKISVQHNLSTNMSFYTFNSLNHYVLFHQKDNFSFH